MYARFPTNAYDILESWPQLKPIAGGQQQYVDKVLRITVSKGPPIGVRLKKDFKFIWTVDISGVTPNTGFHRYIYGFDDPGANVHVKINIAVNDFKDHFLNKMKGNSKRSTYSVNKPSKLAALQAFLKKRTK